MMRDVIKAFICCLFALTLVGCGSKIPELSEEDEAVVIQYMADSLIEHNVGYQSTILTDEEIVFEEEKRKQMEEELRKQKEEEERRASEEASEQTAEEIEVIGAQASKDERDVYTDIDEYLELANFEIKYLGNMIMDSYPTSGEDLFLAVTAKDGYQLLVCTYEVTNTSENLQNLDMASLDYKYRFGVNEDNYKTCLSTLLEDDFSTFSGEFQAGESKQLVLVTEIPDYASIDALKMQIIKQDKTKGNFILD